MFVYKFVSCMSVVMFIYFHDGVLGPVVQSIVSLTTSLRRQLLKHIPTKLSNTLLFFVGKM